MNNLGGKDFLIPISPNMKVGSFIILIFIFFFVPVNAESLDKVVYRIVYNADVKYHKESNMYHETAYLDIGDNVSYFYGLQLKEYFNAMDSIGSEGWIGANYKWGTPPRVSFSVIRNYPSFGKSTYCHFIHEPRIFYYEEDIPQIDWQLVSGDTTLLDYQCKKATCKFRGRDWTVYYTMDIPISEGPWKLCGLPGLVLYARESLGEFTFSCAGIEKPENAYIEVDKRLWTKVGQKEMEEQLIKFYDNIEDWLLRAYGYGLFADKRKTAKDNKNKIRNPCLIESFK